CIGSAVIWRRAHLSATCFHSILFGLMGPCSSPTCPCCLWPICVWTLSSFNACSVFFSVPCRLYRCSAWRNSFTLPLHLWVCRGYPTLCSSCTTHRSRLRSSTDSSARTTQRARFTPWWRCWLSHFWYAAKSRLCCPGKAFGLLPA